jgi:chromosome segregation ATPase
MPTYFSPDGNPEVWDEMPQGYSVELPEAVRIAQRINELKQSLARTDYKAVKAAEGSPGADWEAVKAERQAWRDEINELEARLDDMAAEGGL